jgi:hypothetical protein
MRGGKQAETSSRSGASRSQCPDFFTHVFRGSSWTSDGGTDLPVLISELILFGHDTCESFLRLPLALQFE